MTLPPRLEDRHAEKRAKWERGDKKDFYPYGKTWRQVFVRMSGVLNELTQLSGHGFSGTRRRIVNHRRR